MLENNTAGKSIESYCTKCRVNSDHTIMLMDGEAIGKVRCKNCGSSHRYRNPLIVQTVRKTRIIKVAGEEATTAIVWEASLAEAKGKQRHYRMATKYRIGDIVNHQTFGMGIVVKLYTNKCDMLFKDRERLMASANK